VTPLFVVSSQGGHPARGEARRVGFAANQFLAAELRDSAAVGRRREKRIVLLGRHAGHRLEPVRVVRRAVLDGPVLERARDDVGHVRLDRRPVRARTPQRPVDVLRQARPLDFFVEGQRTEFLGGLLL
jgi:hypothetical protein